MHHYTGKFVFHPVGHGLFYTGEITNDQGKSFSFAFDCGSENEQIVLDIINKGKLPNNLNDVLPEHIDLLIISHFHADHISGALELIKKKNISKVIVPYLTDTTKILYASRIDSSSANGNNLVHFIKDPEAAVKEINDNCEVHFLDENENSEYIQSERTSDSENDSFDFKWCDGRNSSITKHAGNVSFVSPIWEFHFFMPRTDDGSKIQQLEDFFLEKKITVDNAVGHFSEIKAKMRELKLGDNKSNIVCVHGPVKNIDWYEIQSNRGFCLPSYIYWRNRISYFNPYQFLTGDAEVVDKKAFFDRYAEQLSKSVLFQIPHHGSKNNWDDIFSDWQPLCFLWPVTHNTSHKRKKGRGIFPSAIFTYIKDTSVTENPYSKLGLRIQFFLKNKS